MSGGDWKDMFGAALAGDTVLVSHHLDRGVDVDHVHPEYMSTVLVAVLCAGRPEMAHHLLDHGADPALPSPLEQLTPVEAAVQHGHDDVVQRLVGLGIDLPAQRTPPAPPAQPRVSRLLAWLRAPAQ